MGWGDNDNVGIIVGFELKGIEDFDSGKEEGEGFFGICFCGIENIFFGE